MRHLPRTLALVVVTTLAAFGCGEPISAPPPLGHEPDPLLIKLAAAGFDTAGVLDQGEHLLVEGDIRFRKASVAGWETRPVQPGDSPVPNLQYRTTNIVSQTKMEQGLRIDLSGIPSQSLWLTAARAAITEWNNIGSTKVRLIEGSPGDIYIYSQDINSCNPAGRADWPDGANPGPTIFLNPRTGYSPCASASASRRKAIVMHEIGHTLGLRHTNWQYDTPENPDPGAIHIPGTPTGLESASIMTTPVTATSFSNNDRIAVRTMYPPVPPPPPPFSVQIEGAAYTSSPTTMMWNVAVTGGSGSFTYQWQRSMDDVAYEDIPGATDWVYSTYVSASFYLRVQVTSGSETASRVKPITCDFC